jgi:hypothetical protein
VAQAYARSLLDSDKFEVISSGIKAELDYNGAITPWAEDLLQKNNLLPFAEKNWRQTTQELIDGSDVNIFISNDVYTAAAERFKLPSKNRLIWQVPDIDVVPPLSADAIFVIIKARVDGLIATLKPQG